MVEPPINIHIHGTLGARDRARLFNALKKENHMTVPAAKAPPAKPGVLTTEFWISTLTTVGAIAFAVQGSLPPRYAAYAALASTIAYSISRGLAKS